MINKTSFEKRFTLLPPASGVISALLGLSVIIGWHTHCESLLQIIPSFVAMQYNTAIGFLLCGMGLVALAYGRLRLSTVAGSLVTALALLTITEYLFGCDLGIDQLFMNHYITTGVSNPGRMAPNTAVCFLLTGIALLMQHRLFQYKYRTLTVEFFGTIIISLGIVAVFGYLSKAAVAYKWWNLTAMALHTASGFLVLGAGMVVFAWYKSKDEDIDVSRWTPVLVGIEIALVAILFWQALLMQEHLNIEQNVRQKTSSLKTSIEDELKSRSLALNRIAKRWTFHGGTTKEEWSSDANAYLRDYPELQAIEWVNSSFQAAWIASPKDREDNKYPDLPLDERLRVAFDIARNSQKAVVFSSIDLTSGGKGFLLFTPLFVGNNFDGCILGIFNAQRLFDDILKPNLVSEYAATIEDAQGCLYSFSAPDKRYQEDARQETSITFHNAQWKLRLRPSEKLLRESHSLLPPLILAVGFIVGSLFVLIIYVNQKRALLAREIKDANQRLLVEIEEHRQANLALQESEKQIRFQAELLRNAPVIAAFHNRDHIITWANKAYEDATGLPLQTIRGMTCHTVWKLDRLCNNCPVEAAIEAGETREAELTPQNQEHWPESQGCWLSRATPVRDVDGNIIGAIEIAINISDRKRAEDSLRESEERFRTLAEAIPQIVWMTRTDGWNIYFNQQWVDYTGMTREESCGHGWNKPFHPDDQQRSWDAWQHATSTDGVYSLECRLRRKDGVYRWWLIRGTSLHNVKGEVVKWFGTCTDIEDLKQAEIRNMALVRRNQVLMQSTSEGIHILDERGEIIEANDAFCRHLGYTLQEIMQLSVFDFEAKLTADEIRTNIKNLLNGHAVFESVHRRKDGSLVEVEISVSGVELDGQKCLYALSRNITKRKQTEFELKKLNETLEQKVAARVKELEETKEQLYHAQKMESIGKLAGGVAHDFNNILMAIMGYANLAESELPEDNPARVFIQKLLDSTDKATKITQSLLAFSRKQPVSMTSVSLNKIVETVGFLLPKIARESIKCHLSVNTRDCAVLADADKLEQVLMNIANNAVDAMPNGGNLTISTGTVDIDHAFAGKYGLENTGPYSTITISDTGTGMDEETQRKIFEPFFTTKVRGKGTGLGLPIAYGIIKQHNGHIAVSSEPNKGTTFTIYLPLTEKPIVAAVSETTAGTRDASHSGSETILLAEDERGVRDVITNVLERKGYRVIVAVDGEDAVVKFKENLGVIQMLVFDVMMPNKDGKEAYNAIKQIKPNAKILFLSGYSDDIDTNKTIHNEGLPFIQKPIKADKLLRMVREILDA